MTNQEIVLTDPARELAELCAELQSPTGKIGETFLAERFEVEPWSREFFQIVFTVAERCAFLKGLVAKLDLDADLRAEISEHVENVMQAFSATSMTTRWDHHGNTHLSAVHLGPIKAISGLVRQHVAYRKLSDDELSYLDAQVATLLDWLEEHQLSDSDFIRQALIEGLQHFRFRMAKLKWLGWGYTLDSLREVIAAYMLLERSGADPQTNPDAAAILQKVGTLVKSIYAKVTAAKGVVDTGDWLVRAYGVGSLIYQGKPVVTALLS